VGVAVPLVVVQRFGALKALLRLRWMVKVGDFYPLIGVKIYCRK